MADIRTVIVDDEPLARRGVRQLLAPHSDFAVVGECRNGREALKALDAIYPDVVFLDVQMPGLDGFEVIRRRGAERMPLVVFVTAYDTFAVQAFEAHALDYLVKPIHEGRFTATIARIRERFRLATAANLAAQLSALLGNRAVTGNPGIAAIEAVLLPTPTGSMRLSLDEIDWISADDYHAVIHAGGRRHRVRESLGALEQRLESAQFVRVHRGAIVRLDRVRELRSRPGGELVAILRDGAEVPVSRRRRDELEGMLRSASR